jgi:hypothetical protein
MVILLEVFRPALYDTNKHLHLEQMCTVSMNRPMVAI